MMTIALAYEKKHQRRVLPTRTLSASAPAPTPLEGGALEQLHSACRHVVSEVGPSPYLYAQKHCQDALVAMAEVERVLWPDTTNVPASVERMDAARSRAILFRTFRHEVGAETFAAAWASSGPAALVDVVGALDDFDVALAWGTKRIRHIDVEQRARSPLVGGRFTMFTTPAGTAELPLARAVRPYVVGAPADAYARAVERARALHAKERVSLFTRAALAFTLPDETDLAVPVIEALLGSAPTDPLEVVARSEWLRWMLASPLAPALALRILDALDGQVAAAGRRQAIPQLDRRTFSALDGWPVVRGTVVSYRKLERLIDRRGWRLYRTHCGSALHDWSYLQRTVDDGRIRISLGFNFGEHVGDSTLGELIGQDEDGTPGVRHAMRPTPAGLSAIATSELQLDLATLRE